MKLVLLRDELTSDPESLGYAQLADVEATKTLNKVDRLTYKPIESRELLTWSGGQQRLTKIENAAKGHVSADVQNIAKVVFPMLNRPDTSLDLGKQSHLGMVQSLVDGGVLEAADLDELKEMATHLQSRAEELGLGLVSQGDVYKARNLV